MALSPEAFQASDQPTYEEFRLAVDHDLGLTEELSEFDNLPFDILQPLFWEENKPVKLTPRSGQASPLL